MHNSLTTPRLFVATLKTEEATMHLSVTVTINEKVYKFRIPDRDEDTFDRVAMAQCEAFIEIFC